MNPGGNPAIYALVEKAAKMGNPRAQFSLGLMKYRIGDLSFDTANGNLDEALLWYRRAASRAMSIRKSYLRLLTPRASASPGVRSKLTNGMTLQRRLPKYSDVKDDVIKRRDELAHAMSALQIDEAKKLSAEWKTGANR